MNSGSCLGYYSNTRSNSLRLNLISERRGDRRRSNTLDIMDGRINHGGSLARTRSLSSLREGGMYDVQPTTDPVNLMATIFWIAASLLESDYEYEYLLALKLLNKLLIHMPLDKSESREKIEEVQNKLKWNNFPGLQQLFLKGFTSASTQEMTVHLLSKLITISRHALVDPSQLAGTFSKYVIKIYFLIELSRVQISSNCAFALKKHSCKMLSAVVCITLLHSGNTLQTMIISRARLHVNFMYWLLFASGF